MGQGFDETLSPIFIGDPYQNGLRPTTRIVTLHNMVGRFPCPLAITTISSILGISVYLFRHPSIQMTLELFMCDRAVGFEPTLLTEGDVAGQRATATLRSLVNLFLFAK